MQGWEVMTSNNFDHNNWYNNIGMQIKTEQPDLSYPMQQQQQQLQHHLHLHHQQQLQLQQQQSISATTTPTSQTMTTTTNNINNSNPTSPQSMESNDFNQTSSSLFFDINPNRPLGFNPLTPPGYPGAILTNATTTALQQQQTILNQLQQNNHKNHLNQMTTPCRLYNTKNENIFPVTTTATLTPSHTPPMDVTPPKSPKLLNNINDVTPEKNELNHHNNIDNIDNYIDSGDDTRSIDESSDLEDENIKTPKVNSHGKMKMYKCKQCDYVAVTKMTFWEHTKNHIKPEKMLKCLKCPFVTEYKHHLEYHLRNHEGKKPFQCNKCNYNCVNKSMLNSHLKSHSNVYQYRCTDCNYATKYCHSLKLHLRKYSHKPAMVLNSDGTPNPLPIIDVYGTRRGPKTRNGSKQSSSLSSSSDEIIHTKSPHVKQKQLAKSLAASSASSSSHNIPNLMSSMLPIANMLHPGTNHPIFPYLNLNFHMFAVRQQQQQQQQQQQAAALSQLSPNIHDISLSLNSSHDEGDDDDDDDDDDFGYSETNITEDELRNRINRRINSMNHLNDDGDDNSDNNMLITQQIINRKIANDALDLTQTNKNIELWEMEQIKKMKTSLHELDNNDNNNNNNIKNNDHNDINDDDEDEQHNNHQILCGSAPSTPSTNNSKNRRKGRAFKLDIMNKDYSENEEDLLIENKRKNELKNKQNQIKSSLSTPSSQPIKTSAIATTSTTTEIITNDNNKIVNDIKLDQPITTSYDCKFCYISFKDAVLHSIHMGYHGYNDVFKCNMCGEKCDDRISFFLHIARNQHS